MGRFYGQAGKSRMLAELGRIEQAQLELEAARTGARTVARSGFQLALTQARIEAARGRCAAARSAYGEAVQAATTQQLSRHVLSIALRGRAESALAEGDAAGAIADARAAVAAAKVAQGRTDFSVHTGHALLVLAKCLLASQSTDEARETLSAAMQQLVGAVGDDDPRTVEARRLLLRGRGGVEDRG